MPNRSKKKFKPVQFDNEPKPKIRFSFKFIVWLWILIVAAFFVCYIVLANFTDAFIVTKNKKSNTQNNSADVSEPQGTDLSYDLYVNPVPQSANIQGSAYLSNCTFAGDMILSGLSNSGVSDTHIKCGPSYILTNILDSGISVTDKNLYLMLGYTELGEQPSDSLLTQYESVIKTFKENFPNTKIYIMALPPVTDTSTTVLNSSIDDFNSKLLTLADRYGFYYIDTNTILKNNTGYLSSNYFDSDGLTEAAYNKIVDHVLSHTVE